MRLTIDAKLDYELPDPADLLLQLEAAQMPDQILVEDELTVTTDAPLTPVAGLQDVGRRTWTGGQGNFVAHYHATVDIVREPFDLNVMQAVPLQALPGNVVHFLWPSHYVQSDQLKPFAVGQFGLPGGAAVAAMARWTQDNIEYLAGCSDATTTACHTFELRKGICRDFAHVMLSFCRALDMPARMVSAYAWNIDPPDFHAVVEVYLSHPEQGPGWHLVDPSGLAEPEGIVRIGVGRDAVDISFMTIFGGNAMLNSQSVTVERVD